MICHRVRTERLTSRRRGLTLRWQRLPVRLQTLRRLSTTWLYAWDTWKLPPSWKCFLSGRQLFISVIGAWIRIGVMDGGQIVVLLCSAPYHYYRKQTHAYFGNRRVVCFTTQLHIERTKPDPVFLFEYVGLRIKFNNLDEVTTVTVISSSSS